MNPDAADTWQYASGDRVRSLVRHQLFNHSTSKWPVDSLRDSSQPIHLTHKSCLGPSDLGDLCQWYLTRHEKRRRLKSGSGVVLVVDGDGTALRTASRPRQRKLPRRLLHHRLQELQPVLHLQRLLQPEALLLLLRPCGLR